MAWSWHDGKIRQMEMQNERTKSFTIEVDNGGEPFDFVPGQFITMDLPISDSRLKRWRSYSIANAPNGSNTLELCIGYLDGGAASDYLFNQVKIGDSIRFKGPSGAFVLPENISDKKLVLICTGTGVAPFRSMIQQIYQKKIANRGIHLIFGAREEEDILYREAFESTAAHSVCFKYDIALSRDMNWTGYKGHVHQAYLHKYAESVDNCLFFLCGWTPMVDEAVENLMLKLGCDPKQIKYELYG